MTTGRSATPRRLRTALRHGAVTAMGPVLRRLPRGGALERFLLERTWAAVPAEMLDEYLVSGFQNPRINVQSILLRHFLLRRLFGPADPELEPFMADELRLAFELNELLRARAAELGVRMGSYVDPAKHAAVRRVEEVLEGRDHEPSTRLRAALGGRRAEPISVLEMACGSANDYRAFVECGLAELLDYRGIDLAPKNVENARRRFPGVRFEVGDVRAVEGDERSADYVIASDIFEHLSIDGMTDALGEATRLARRGVALTFFNMDEIAEHEVRPQRVYFWNRLSRERIERRLRDEFASVEVIPIAVWLAEHHGVRRTYNRHAYSIFAER